MDLALEAVEAAFRKVGLDEAENVPRRRCQTDHVMLHVLPAAAKTLGAIGFKAYTTGKFGARCHVTLFDPKTGELAARMEAAPRKLARPDAATVGLFGTGGQARTQLEAVCAVRAIKQAKVYSRDVDRRK